MSLAQCSLVEAVFTCDYAGRERNCKVGGDGKEACMDVHTCACVCMHVTYVCVCVRVYVCMYLKDQRDLHELGEIKK